MRKQAKRRRVRRLQVERWRRANVNHRSDDERYANDAYFYELSPVRWLSAISLKHLRDHVDPASVDQMPDPATFIEDLRAQALADIDTARNGREQFLRDARADQESFVRMSGRHWRTAFDLFEMYVWNSIEVHADIDRRLEEWGADDPMTQVVMRTAGRGMRIGREVGWLLRGGYPEAARSRWRTLHELAVMVTYIRVHGPLAAERIAAHELLQTLQYNQAARMADGSEEAIDDDFEWERDALAELTVRYGKSFSNRYGWASNVTKNPKPTFKDIEDAAGMSGWRKSYEAATYSAHATSRPLHEESFIRHGRDVFAPTNAGLATPAVMTIRTLLQVSCATLGLFVQSIADMGSDLQTAILLDAIARETIDAWASHEWPEWGLKHIPG